MIDPWNQDRCHGRCEPKEVEAQDYVSQCVAHTWDKDDLTLQGCWNIPDQQTQASEEEYCLVDAHDHP